MIEPLYVCVYVPEFPAQARLRLRPELSGTPVVVLAGDPPIESVCSVNALASRLGVTQGMTRAELDSFPCLTVWKRSEPEERLTRDALLEAAGAFTPRVEITASTPSAFAMVLDMAGSTRIFGPASRAVKQVRKAMSTLRLFTQLAASTNFHTAVCVAPSARKTPSIVQAGREREHLSALPLAALSLMPSQAETLAMWGLHTLGDLAALPEVELIVRLGQEGKRLRSMARGEHPHLMVPRESGFVLEEFIELDTPIEVLDSLLFVLGPMLDQLLARAQRRAYALAVVTLRLGLEGGGQHERTVKPSLPVTQREVLLKLLHLDLQAHPPAAGVSSLYLHAEAGDLSKVQFGLFAPQLPEPLRLDVTLARIASLVGEDHIGSPRLRDAHRPDSFTMERFGVPSRTPNASKRGGVRYVMSLRRYRPPVLLSVQLQALRLSSFFLHGKRYVVREAYGPWRKSGEWWTDHVWSLEEWDVCATTTAKDTEPTMLCVIRHDRLRHRWYLVALYD